MGMILYQPDDMTWAEWMCELMCGSPEPDDTDADLATDNDSDIDDEDADI